MSSNASNEPAAAGSGSSAAAAASSSADAKPAATAQLPVPEAIEEDDEFEDFKEESAFD